MLLEVDSRKVEGTGGTVSLYLGCAADEGTCAIIVRDASGQDRARADYTDRGEALRHYRHTFAYADGPALPVADGEPVRLTEAAAQDAAVQA